MLQILICLMILIAEQLFPSPSFAMTAETLKAIMDGKESVTIIDVRNNSDFTNGHIQGSINIPADICSTKRLPPIGKAVVYSDDISVALTNTAIDCLNNKSGIEADVLAGGIGRWELLNYPMVGGNGFTRDENRYVSYQQFVDIAHNNKDLLFIDLRRTGNSETDKNKTNTGGQAVFADLSSQFPGIKTRVLSPEQVATGDSAKNLFVSNLKESDPGHTVFYVLIDRLNGVAEDMAKRFKESGLKRFVILAGGEEIILRKGTSGTGTYNIEDRQ